MIADLKPYPGLKDSGVEWLGDVPEHWEVRKVREVARVINGFPFDAGKFSQSTGYQLIRIRDLDRAKTATFYDGPFVESAKVNPGEVLIGMDGDFNVGTWRGTEPALLNQRMCCIRSVESDIDRFLAYFLPRPLKQINDVTWSTTVKHLASGQVERIQFGLPPLPERTAIVRFLDHVDRRIRRYIRAKQRLIKLLEEQKQAIIHRAVTRGLDPNVRLKPSGVEWLGEVPEHWEVSPIRSLARVVRGGSPRPAGSTLYFHGTGPPWITVGEVTRASGIYVTETATRLTPAGAERSRMIEPGTLLLTNSGATLGIPKISRIQGCINDGVAAFLDLQPRIRREFLLHYFTTQTVHLKARVDLGAQPNLNTQIIGSWPAPIPSVEEQDQIHHYIERSTKVLDHTAACTRSEIGFLREYLTRLIADVVTGKLDVREAAARLPDEAEEAEPLDVAEAQTDLEEDDDDADGAAVPEEAEA